MIAIDQVLLSEEIFESFFKCNLSACQGACCWEGDWGAPLTDEEREILETIREPLRPYLSDASNAVLDEKGTHEYFAKGEFNGTTLHKDGACAYLTRDEHGVAKCGIEQAHQAGAIDFIKPISCHLYPIREVDLKVGVALNYDRWSICSAACKKGKDEKVTLLQFCKEALIRRFGKDFYDQAMEIAEAQQENR